MENSHLNVWQKYSGWWFDHKVEVHIKYLTTVKMLLAILVLSHYSYWSMNVNWLWFWNSVPTSAGSGCTVQWKVRKQTDCEADTETSAVGGAATVQSHLLATPWNVGIFVSGECEWGREHFYYLFMLVVLTQSNAMQCNSQWMLHSPLLNEKKSNKNVFDIIWQVTIISQS